MLFIQRKFSNVKFFSEKKKRKNQMVVLGKKKVKGFFGKNCLKPVNLLKMLTWKKLKEKRKDFFKSRV